MTALTAVAITSSVIFSFSPLVGIDVATWDITPSNDILAYGAKTSLNIGPVGITLFGSIVPYELRKEGDLEGYEDKRVKRANAGGSVGYEVKSDPVTLRFGAEYNMARLDYYRLAGAYKLGYEGQGYLLYDHSILFGGAFEMGDLVSEEGPVFTFRVGIGPALIKSEGRTWHISPGPESTVTARPLNGNAITCDVGSGLNITMPLFPHFAVTGTTDMRIKAFNLKNADIPGTSGFRCSAYIGPILYF